ncbi:MAG: permease-like cell division protein FtsX [bacterium]
MRRIRFILREALRALIRSGLAGWLAILSMAAVAGFCSSVWGARQALEAAREGLLAQFELEAFVRPGREEKLHELGKWMRAREGVVEVVEVNKAMAAERFSERFGKEMFDLLDHNPLPVSLIVKYDPKVVNVKWITLEAQVLADHPDIEEVAYEGELLGKLEDLGTRLSMGLLIVAAVIAGIAIFLTFQSVRVAIRSGLAWARAVRLVGGTERQVRQPFVIAGILAGLFGGVLGAGLVGAVQFLLAQSGAVPVPQPIALLAVLVLTMLIGALGSAAAIGRRSHGGIAS